MSGESYEDFINGLMLGPLGMIDTRPNNVPPNEIVGLTEGYSHVSADEGGEDCVSLTVLPHNCASAPPPRTKCKPIPTGDLRLPEESFAAGWLVSNQIDMSRLEKALHEMSSLLLKKDTYDLMWTNRRFNDGKYDRFGLGWLVCSEKNDMFCPKPVDPEAGGDLGGAPLNEPVGADGKVVSKDGAVTGYSSEILHYLDDGLTVIVLSNIKDDSFEPVGLAAEIALVVRQSGE